MISNQEVLNVLRLIRNSLEVIEICAIILTIIAVGNTYIKLKKYFKNKKNKDKKENHINLY